MKKPTLTRPRCTLRIVWTLCAISQYFSQTSLTFAITSRVAKVGQPYGELPYWQYSNTASKKRERNCNLLYYLANIARRTARVQITVPLFLQD